jgi:hypothetical protein
MKGGNKMEAYDAALAWALAECATLNMVPEAGSPKAYHEMFEAELTKVVRVNDETGERPGIRDPLTGRPVALPNDIACVRISIRETALELLEVKRARHEHDFPL